MSRTVIVVFLCVFAVPSPVGAREPAGYAHGIGLRPLVGGSQIRRESVGTGVTVAPLYSYALDRRFLERQRMLEGVAVSDTEAWLGLGGPGTARMTLRLEPTLIL